MSKVYGDVVAVPDVGAAVPVSPTTSASEVNAGWPDWYARYVGGTCRSFACVQSPYASFHVFGTTGELFNVPERLKPD